jgi:hypothetical protein
MTKFYATVCLPPTAPRKVPGAIAAALAPYDINLGPDWNANGQWDWWVVAATTGAGFLVLPAHDGDRRLITASTVPRRKAALDPLGPLECYGGPRGLLDFDAMRRRSMAGHDALLAAWHELAAEHPPARPLAVFVARHEADPDGYSMADAKRDHLAQPSVQALAQRAVAGDPHFGTWLLVTDPVAYFAQEHEAERLETARYAVPGRALVTLEGAWTDAETDGYWEQANSYVDGLDAEAVVVVVLCPN